MTRASEVGESCVTDDTNGNGADGRGEAILPSRPPQETRHPARGTEVRPDLRGYVYLALMVLIGSTTSPLAKVVVRELPVGLLPVLRFGFASLCLLPFVKDWRAFRRMLRDDLGLLLLVAACCVPINQGFFLNAARLGPNSHVGLFYATVPLVVWLLAWSLGHEALNLKRLTGVLVSMAGVLVIGLGNLWGGSGAPVAETRAVMLADLLLIGAVISWGSYVTLSRPLILRHGAMNVLAGTFIVGALLDLPIALATMPGWLPMLGQASRQAWISFGVLALMITPVNLALQNISLRRLDSSQVAAFSNVAPVLTVLWGFLFFREQLGPALIAGGLLTMGGIVWTTRPARSPARGPDEVADTADARLAPTPVLEKAGGARDLEDQGIAPKAPSVVEHRRAPRVRVAETVR